MVVRLDEQFSQGFRVFVPSGKGAENAAASVVDDAQDTSSGIQLREHGQRIGIIQGGQVP